MTTPRSTPPGPAPGDLAAAIAWQRARVISRVALAVTLVTVVGLVACDDLTHRDQPAGSTSRKSPIGSPRRDNYPNVSPDPAGHDSPDDPTISLVMQAAYDGTMGSSGTSVNYPYLTAVRVVARGLESRTPNYPEIGGAITRGPAQRANFGWVDGGVYSGTQILGAGGDMSIDTASGYYFIRGGLTNPAKTGYGYRVYDGQMFNGVRIWCGQIQTINPCDTWAGSTTVEFIRLQSTLTIAVDSSSVVPGSAVEFTWGASPAYVEGQQMPVVVDTTRWIPDPDSLGGEPTEQATTGNNACDYTIQQGHCKRRIIGSGTFTAKVYVNGKRFAGSVHVQAPTLSLRATPTSGAAGVSVTFVPKWSDGQAVTAGSVNGYAWTPDTTPGTTGGCGGGAASCQRSVMESGTMTVTVVRGGVSRTARAHVLVSKCPMGDDIGDRPEVRQAFKDIWHRSGADVDTIAANHIEYIDAVYQDTVDGSVFVQSVSNTGTPCIADSAAIIPKVLGSAKLTATIHPHPFKWGSTYPPNCGSMAGAQYQGPKANGRASGFDWKTSQELNVPGYIIDYDGIYKYDGSGVKLIPITDAATHELLEYLVINPQGHYQAWPLTDTTHGCTRP